MEKEMHVLIVEDLPSDAELAERELKTALKNFTVQVVDTKEDFVQALKTFKPELIISDYQMPAFDGLSALRITREKSPLVPFVMLTGSMNEDTAVDCMKAGADDYVIKEHIKRLGPAVLSALEKKRVEVEYKRAEQIKKALYNISNAVITTDNLKKVAGIMRKEIGVIIDTTNFYIALYDHKTDTISLPFVADEKEEVASVPEGKTLTKYVINSQNSLLADGEKLKELEQSGMVDNYGSDTKVWLGVPLKIEGKITGLIAVQSYTNENAYDESDMEMLEFVSDQISILIDRKQAEEKLIAALKKAEESDRLKSAFLANMSHEIRTPMNGILGFSELLKEPDLTGEEQEQYLAIIESSGKRMLNIINDLVNISQIESGQMEISISETNLNEIIEYLNAFFKAEIEKKGVQLFTKTPLSVEEAILKTDEEKIHGILTNLINNAIKFTEKGSIEFGYEKKANFFEFFVKDTGIGIAKDRQLTIFERFIQADMSPTRLYEGAGLGLSISKAYVEMLGGKIWVESEEGKGSVFYFTIPW